MSYDPSLKKVIGQFVKNGIFQFFLITQKSSQNFQKISIPSNSLDNFLHFTFSDHLSISKIKIPKLPLKSGTPLRPLRFGHFCRFFQSFSHILRNPLELAKNWKLHQIPWTISHIFCIIHHFSISRFRCPKLPSKSATLYPCTDGKQQIQTLIYCWGQARQDAHLVNSYLSVTKPLQLTPKWTNVYNL